MMIGARLLICVGDQSLTCIMSGHKRTDTAAMVLKVKKRE